jgi:hypothetical protein
MGYTDIEGANRDMPVEILTNSCLREPSRGKKYGVTIPTKVIKRADVVIR